MIQPSGFFNFVFEVLLESDKTRIWTSCFSSLGGMSVHWLMDQKQNTLSLF